MDLFGDSRKRRFDFLDVEYLIFINMGWQTFSGLQLSGNIQNLVEKTIIRETENGHRIRICIGTDSQVNARLIHFATAVVFVREKQGGFMFIKQSLLAKKGIELKERLILEVGKSVETAYGITGVVRKYNVPLEIHADINTDEESASFVAMKEALGYIKGMGFHYKLKPDAFASSSCADKYV